MKPNMALNIFDLLVLPQHDKFQADPNTKCPILRTIGAMNNVQARIDTHSSNFVAKYPSMKSFIGIIVGGNTKEYKFSEADAKELCAAIENVAIANGLPVFITFSRRTPDTMKKIFRETFEWPNVIYDPTINDGTENPYIDMLKHAKFLVLTCDSVSMCSEAASSGKPLYIYLPKKFKSAKHKYLLQQLIDLKIAHLFSKATGSMEEYHYPPLNEVDKVAEYVKGHLLL
jgi:mitochondrial fission protein ELM1